MRYVEVRCGTNIYKYSGIVDCSKSSRQCSLRDKVRDKLSKKQYDDEVSWTTCTWSALMAQRMSVALHMAAAWEIARELSLAGAEDEAALFGGGVADSVA